MRTRCCGDSSLPASWSEPGAPIRNSPAGINTNFMPREFVIAWCGVGSPRNGATPSPIGPMAPPQNPVRTRAVVNARSGPIATTPSARLVRCSLANLAGHSPRGASALHKPNPLHPVICDGQPGYLTLLIVQEGDDASVGGFLHVDEF